VYQQYDHKILSKPNRRKLATEEREKIQLEEESNDISNDFPKGKKQAIAPDSAITNDIKFDIETKPLAKDL